MRLNVTGTLLTVLLLVLPAFASAQDERAAPTAWLGVTLGASESLDGTAPRGARISGVVSDGPAARSGLRAGDIVLSVDGRPVNAPSDLVSAIGALDRGQWVELRIERQGDESSRTVRLGEPPDMKRRLDLRRGWAGLTLIDVPRQLQEAWGGEGGTGVLVGEVAADSPAELGGVRPGDLVLSIGGQPVRGAFELLPRLRGGGVGNKVELGISRQGTLLDVTVELIDEPPREAGDRRESRRSGWRNQRGQGTTVTDNFFSALEDLPENFEIVIIEDQSEVPPRADEPDEER